MSQAGESAARPQGRLLRSVGTHLALATALLMLLATAVIYGALTRNERANLLGAKSRAARMVCSLFAESLAPALVFEDQEGIQESLAYLKSNREIEQAAVFALDANGRPAAKLGELARSTRFIPLARPAKADVPKLRVRDLYLDVSEWVRDSEGKRIGATLLRFSLAHEQQHFALLSRRILQVAGLVAVGLTVLLLLLARLYIISPLRALHVAVSGLQAGGKPGSDGLAKLPLQAQNEVGDLARAFVDMAQAIERRELAIAARNEEMRLVLESVGQGFLLLSADGRVVGQHSAIVEKWFGAVLSGQPLWEQLRSHDAVQAEWLELAWSNIGAPMMPLELCLEQLPKRFEANGRIYDFEYRPSCTESGVLERMVVIISDVTELVARERTVSEQRELAGVLGSIAADRSGFMSFFEDASLLLNRIVAADAGSRHQLLEDIHTLKGNAGLFHMRSLASLCEAAETRLASEGGLLSAPERAALLHCFERTAAVVESLAAPGEQRELALGAGDYQAIEAALRRGDGAEAVLVQLSRATAEPAELLFRRFTSRLEVLARALGKCPLDVRAEGNGLRFPKLLFAPLWAALVHALRNIADHGLETAQERERAGKSPRALVEMSAERRADKVLIRLRDDGRGVDLQLVAARAAQRGLKCDGERELLEALFASGLSAATEQSKLSGRGVGLSALKSAVTDLGGKVSIHSRRGHGTELRIELSGQLI